MCSSDLGGFLLLSGAALTFTSLGKLRQTGDKARRSNPDNSGNRYMRVAILTGVAVLYTLGLTYIGYIVSTILALAGAMVFSGERRSRLVVVISVITSVTLYYFFHKLMQVPLPHTLLF